MPAWPYLTFSLDGLVFQQAARIGLLGWGSLASQTLYRLVLALSEGSGHSCTHFWCSWNALISVWDFYLKPDVGRITLRCKTLSSKKPWRNGVLFVLIFH